MLAKVGGLPVSRLPVSPHHFSQVGLLPADNREQVPFAYKMYAQDDAFGWEQSSAFKKTFSIDVDVEFLGVWCVPAPCCETLPDPDHPQTGTQSILSA
jgi:hypothetical protein